MSSSVDVQSLIASFSLGIVVVAGSAAVYFFTRGNAPSSLRAASRLVLVAFLVFSALWALVDFIASLIRDGSNLACHVAIGFASAFDQLARVLLQQSLLWLSFGDIKKSPWLYALQVALLLRLILGAVFVGFQQPQFKPVCVTSTRVLPLGIAVLAVDMILIFSFLMRSMRTSVRVDAIKSKMDTDRSRSMLLGLAGFSFWTALSSPMILGIMSLDLVLRTTLPAIGLTIVIVLVTVFKTSLTGSQTTNAKNWPEDPNVRDYDMTNVSEPTQRARGRFSYRPPSRYADVKNGSRTSVVPSNPPNASMQTTVAAQTNFSTQTTISAEPNAHAQPSVSAQMNKVLPTISPPNPGQSSVGVGGVAVQGQLFPPPKVDITAPSIQDGDYKERFWSKFAKRNGSTSANLVISNPIMNFTDNQNPLNRIATIDLKTAANQDRQRREEQTQPVDFHMVATRRAPKPPTMSPEQMATRSSSVKGRKQVGSSVAQADKTSNLDPIPESGQASSSSAQLSPGVEEIRRRSPRRDTVMLPAELPGSPVPPRAAESAVNGSIDARVNEKDAWDLLAIPKNEPEATDTRFESPRLPPSPAAKRISVAPTTVKSPGTKRRSSASSISSKKSKATIAIFTDPNIPPPIPQQCVEANEELQNSGTEPPPPYKADFNISSPSHMTKPLPPPPMPQAKTANSSPRLFIFPPNTQPKTVVAHVMKGPDSANSSIPSGPTSKGRPRIPLPANPKPTDRSRSVKRQEEQQPTIMFLNKIEYDEPWDIEDLVGDHKDAVRPVSIKSTRTVKGESVVNRPRPIPRKAEMSRRFNTYSRLLNPQPHRRSLSCGSVSSKKSILRFEPPSPTNLPPLPPLPVKDTKPLRSQLNHVKSMTLDEKIELFFPPSSPSKGSSRASSRRRSRSLPDISVTAEEHRISRLLQGKDGSGQPAEIHADEFTKLSIRTQGLLELSEALQARDPANYSARTPKEEESRVYLASPASNDEDYLTSLLSPPPLSLNNRIPSPIKESDVNDMGDESTTHWGSVHSPVAAINIQRAKEVELPRRPSTVIDHVEPRRGSVEVHAMIADDKDGQISARLFIDTAEVGEDALLYQPESEQAASDYSPLSDYGPNQAFWHRRVGDECPTFSARQDAKPRKMPPPAPLVLNRPPKTPVLVQAEPSPLESPQHALDVIEEQLRNLDSPYENQQVDERQRMTLLEDLELEMGMQESRWQSMRHTYIRDSLSTVDMSPVEDSRNSSTSPKPGHASLKSILAARRESRRLSRQSRESAEVQIAAVIGADEAQTNRWSNTLAEAEYRNSRSDFLTSTGSRISFLAVSHQPSAQIASPTPPDTDESDHEADYESGVIEVPFILSEPVDNGPVSPPETRQPIPEPQLEPKEQQKAIQTKIEAAVSPGTSQARVLRLEHTMSTRRDSRLLPPIDTSKRLPEVPAEASKISPKPSPKLPIKPPSPKQIRAEPAPQPNVPTLVAPKPKSFIQRPMRRTKRMTALPDILESPLPLPDKKNTLGIFKFPGGKATDTAAFPMRQPFRAPMPGTMTSGSSMVVPAVPGVPGVPTYGPYLPGFGPPGAPSSFFDDMDEEDAGDNFDDFDDEYNVDDEEDGDEDDDDNDDDFDETTLWEIASLLKSDRVPSRASLFPNQWSGDQDQPQATESLSGPPSPPPTSIPMILDIGTPDLPQRPISLWENESVNVPAPRKTHGLPQPSRDSWKTYVETTPTSRRASRGPTMSTASISSTSLWQQQQSAEAASLPATSMWSAEKQTKVPGSPSEPNMMQTSAPQASEGLPSRSLWTTTTDPNDDTHEKGLWRTPSQSRAEIDRTPELNHADVRRKPSKRTKALSELQSSNLWATKQTPSAQGHNWLRRAPSQTSEKPTGVNGPGLWAPNTSISREHRSQWLGNGPTVSFANTMIPNADTDFPRKKPTLTAALPQLQSSSLWSIRDGTVSSAPRPDWIAITKVVSMAERMAPSSLPVQEAPRQVASPQSNQDIALNEALAPILPQKVYISTPDASLWTADSSTEPSDTSKAMWKPQRTTSTSSRTSWAPNLPPVQRQKRVSTAEPRSSIAPNITSQNTWSKEEAKSRRLTRDTDWLGAY